MTQHIEEMGREIWAYLPNLIGALLILAAGWVLALGVAALVRGILRRTSLDDRIAKWLLGEERAERLNVERGLSKVAFYTILILVLVAFFQALGLTLATQPLNKMLTQVFEFIPRLLGALLLLLVAWLVGSGMRLLVRRGASAAGLDEKLGSKEEGKAPVSGLLGDIVYWLVLLLFLPAVVGALQLGGLLEPVTAMTERFLAFLPNVFAAALILVVGWFVARIVQRIATGLLVAVGVDRLSERVGLAKALGERKLSGALGLVVQIVILVPVAIAALNALQLEAVTQPASNMLDTVLGALPSIFAAALILLFSYLVARVAAAAVVNLLTGVGFNTILVRLKLCDHEPAEDETTPAEVAGYVVILLTMLFAALEAAQVLGFTALAGLVTELTVFAGRVLFGVIILGFGLWLANLAGRAVRSTERPQSGTLAIVTRVTILGLTTAVALQQIGVADDIIRLAFGLLLGAGAVAAALAFGLGGREFAARKLSEWGGEKKEQ